MNPFFISLPAILGIVAFTIYQILKKSIVDDPIVKNIIDHIRKDHPQTLLSYEGLTKSQKVGLLKNDQDFRNSLSVRELDVLDNVLRRRHQTNIYVYSLTSILLLAGIILFIYQPKELFVDNIQIQNTNQMARSIVVDLDPINVTWTSTGQDQILFAVLENVETGQQSNRIRVQASEGKVTFISDRYDNYDKILSNRQPLQYNRIRAILYAGKEAFPSKEFEVKVGVTLYCLANLPNQISFFAVIDNRQIDNYLFLPKLALFHGPHFTKQVIYEGRELASKHEFIINHPETIDLKNYVLSYNNSDDDRIVRTVVDLSEFYKTVRK